jgi:hypothetical protein
LRNHDKKILTIFETVRQLMVQPEPQRKQIGFQVREKPSRYMAKPK